MIDRRTKVSSVILLDELEREEEASRFKALRPGEKQGVIRRPFPIHRPQKALRQKVSRSFRELGTSTLASIESSGVFAEMAIDAADYIRHGGGRTKGPVGRGGVPIGDDRRRLISRIWKRGPWRMVAQLLEEEIDSWVIEFSTTLSDEYIKLYNFGGVTAHRLLKVSPAFDLQDPRILQALLDRANLISGRGLPAEIVGPGRRHISQSVFDRLRTVIAEKFYVEGRGFKDVAASLRAEFAWLGKVRSETIARTETLAIVSEATQTTHEASGVELKRWLTTLDGRERDTHFEAHGQMRKIAERFKVGDAELLFPGEPTEDHPEETINCRCAVIPVVLADQQFEDSDVWRGDVDPDEFSKERLARAA